MPLSLAKEGEVKCILKIGGMAETKQFLEKLGFVVGEMITIISEISGNLIVQVKESRVAISKEMASKIIVR